jgi:4-hydroxy-3-methylbut-2-en-1-yl diphosphate reductase
MFKLVEDRLDLMVVIGGYNSSNTTHLQEIAVERGIPSYHIDSAARIGPGNRVEHKPLHRDLETQPNWLPDGSITVGITSGASTPDRVVEAVIEQIFAIKAASLVSQSEASGKLLEQMQAETHLPQGISGYSER